METEFDKWAKTLRPRLHRYCAGMMGSVIDGEDVLQEALLKAHLAMKRETLVDRPEPWLFCIAHNTALDHLRRRKRDRAAMMEDVDMDGIEDGRTTAESRQIAAEALRAFMHPPVLQRSACILVDVLGYSLDESGVVVDSTLAGTKAAMVRRADRSLF